MFIPNEKTFYNNITKNIGTDDTSLLCPVCGGNNLHHTDVFVSSRRSEDNKVGITASISDGGKVAITGEANSENPSARRNGMSIYFYCEQCDDTATYPLRLNLYQHKGTTYIEWA